MSWFLKGDLDITIKHMYSRITRDSHMIHMEARSTSVTVLISYQLVDSNIQQILSEIG